MSSEFLAWQQGDYYALLGVTRMADADEIRKAFRLRAKDCHPDRFPLGSPEHEAASTRFKELLLAKETLLDPQRREAYDRQQDLIQQAWLDAVIYQVPVQSPPSARKSFSETLKRVYQQYQAQENSSFSHYDSTSEAEESAPSGKGVPPGSRKNAASFYYAQGMRLAARGQFRRALYALNNARMLDPELSIPESFLMQIRAKAWYSRS